MKDITLKIPKTLLGSEWITENSQLKPSNYAYNIHSSFSDVIGENKQRT